MQLFNIQKARLYYQQRNFKKTFKTLKYGQSPLHNRCGFNHFMGNWLFCIQFWHSDSYIINNCNHCNIAKDYPGKKGFLALVCYLKTYV